MSNNKSKEIKWRYNIGDRIVDYNEDGSIKRDMIITDRKIVVSYDKNNNKYNYRYYKYYCNLCGYDGGRHYNINNEKYHNELWILESNLFNQKNGCACCCIPSRIVIEGINDIPTTAPFMIPYFQGGYNEAKLYTYGSNKHIYPICPDCGRIKEKLVMINTIYSHHSIGCICSDGISYPEKFMYSLLEQLKIEFITEYSPEWIKSKRYDFYIPSLKLIIEMDGELGHGKRVISKRGITKQESLNIDDYKDKLAREHEIEVVRIDCDKSKLDYIKQNILSSRLNELFNLSIMDWLKCEEFALNNLVKKTCEIKKDNPNLTTGDIGCILNLDAQTIRKYLIRGSNIWNWISYNSIEERKIFEEKRIKKCIEKCSKQVEIFKSGISLGVFPSCAELSRQSEELFGVKLLNSGISKSCNGKAKTYKKEYTFRYI